jgi:hypothetical protein
VTVFRNYSNEEVITRISWQDKTVTNDAILIFQRRINQENKVSHGKFHNLGRGEERKYKFQSFRRKSVNCSSATDELMLSVFTCS